MTDRNRTSMGPSRSCWNGTTSALQPEEITSKGTWVLCMYYQIKVPIWKKSGNLFNDPRIYIYIYIYISCFTCWNKVAASYIFPVACIVFLFSDYCWEIENLFTFSTKYSEILTGMMEQFDLVWFGLVWFYCIRTVVDYLMPNFLYIWTVLFQTI